jgi:hypothetical protein
MFEFYAHIINYDLHYIMKLRKRARDYTKCALKLNLYIEHKAVDTFREFITDTTLCLEHFALMFFSMFEDSVSENFKILIKTHRPDVNFKNLENRAHLYKAVRELREIRYGVTITPTFDEIIELAKNF